MSKKKLKREIEELRQQVATLIRTDQQLTDSGRPWMSADMVFDLRLRILEEVEGSHGPADAADGVRRAFRDFGYYSADHAVVQTPEIPRQEARTFNIHEIPSMPQRAYNFSTYIPPTNTASAALVQAYLNNPQQFAESIR
jgi:hypothetical protein